MFLLFKIVVSLLQSIRLILHQINSSILQLVVKKMTHSSKIFDWNNSYLGLTPQKQQSLAILLTAVKRNFRNNRYFLSFISGKTTNVLNPRISNASILDRAGPLKNWIGFVGQSLLFHFSIKKATPYTFNLLQNTCNPPTCIMLAVHNYGVRWHLTYGNTTRTTS